MGEEGHPQRHQIEQRAVRFGSQRPAGRLRPRPSVRSQQEPRDNSRYGNTLGYIAPELTRTGKATPSSDMFSFGVLMLEVACGRKPVDFNTDAEQLFLVEWVWELYTQANLLVAADPKLGEDYDACQMDMVLKLGLLCSHPEAERRPGIRHVSQILEGEAPLPDVHLASVNMSVTGLSTMGGFRYAADANHGNKIREELACGSQSNGMLSSTS